MKRIEIDSPNIGHGNPFTAFAIGKKVGGEVHVLSGGGVCLLLLAHRVMSRFDRVAEGYTERSEKVRSGLGGLVIGLLQLEAWLREERLSQFKGKPLAEEGIFVQEHLLGILPEELLKRWFPQGVFLYIPDVFPKDSAVTILSNKRIIRPIVWNQQAFEKLQKEGLNPILAQPVLPFGLIDCEKLPQINSKKRVLKSSGSGISKGYLEEIVRSREKGETLEVWLPNRKIVYDDENPKGKQEKVSKDLKEYGQSFYFSILDAAEIISYPSEMVQVIASLLAKGWRGKFRVLPPRGKHEIRNLEWLKSFITPKKEGEFSVFDFSSKETQEAIDRLVESLGKEDLLSLIEENKRDLPVNLAVSSEALRLPFFPPPPIKQELVISSVQQLQKERDWSKISGIHFRTGKRLKEEDFYQQLIEIIKEAGQRNIGYVTIHLEDLPSEASQTREKLNELNQLAQENNVLLLLENVAPRVDQNLQRWQYSLIEFVEEFGEDLGKWSNIGFCLDIAHLGLAEPEVLEVLGKVFEGWLTGVYNLERILINDELSAWNNFYQILKRTKTIHWSRSKGRSQRIFQVFEKIASNIPPKLALRVHQIYTFLENSFFAHYSLFSDNKFFAMVIIMLQKLGWRGTIVIESPDILELVREKHFPHQKEIRELGNMWLFILRASLKHFFENKGLEEKDANDLINFAFAGFEIERINPRFFDFLEKYFPLIRSFYQDKQGVDFRRKVNGGLYLRHILRAMVWGEVLFEGFVKKGFLTKEDYLAFILSVAGHDALEIVEGRSKEWLVEELKNQGIEEKEAVRIGGIVALLTPEKKDERLTYQERKREDFQKVVDVWHQGDKIPLLVKITDILANLDETIDDLEKGRENGQMRPLEERYQVFKERIGEIGRLVGKDFPAFKLLEERLRIIEDFLFWRLPEDISL